MPLRVTLALLTAVLGLLAGPVRAAGFAAGSDYVLIQPPQPTHVAAGKVEVLEVFSYGCPACNTFQPTMERLKHALPPNAELAYLPAAFSVAEDWPMFQRAFLTAQILGIAAKTHQAMFDAVWQPGGELATFDAARNLKRPQPSIEDAARFYARVGGVKAETFLATARSFSVDMKMKAADAQILAMQIPSTPSIVVAGKYRIVEPHMDQLAELVRFLIAKEAAGH